MAHEIASLVRYKGLSVAHAAEEVVMAQLKAAGGEGGVIVLDARGRAALRFNTEGMYRGVIGEDGSPRVAIYDGEP